MLQLPVALHQCSLSVESRYPFLLLLRLTEWQLLPLLSVSLTYRVATSLHSDYCSKERQLHYLCKVVWGVFALVIFKRLVGVYHALFNWNTCSSKQILNIIFELKVFSFPFSYPPPRYFLVNRRNLYSYSHNLNTFHLTCYHNVMILPLSSFFILSTTFLLTEAIFIHNSQRKGYSQQRSVQRFPT